MFNPQPQLLPEGSSEHKSLFAEYPYSNSNHYNKKHTKLVGGFNPIEKYYSQIGSSSPDRGENNKYLKPPPSYKKNIPKPAATEDGLAVIGLPTLLRQVLMPVTIAK